MTPDRYARAQAYLATLCGVRPNRRTGSPGNREATEFFADIVRSYGYAIDAAPFPCLDYVCKGASLIHDGQALDVHVSPYSLGCDVKAELIAVSTEEELERADCRDRIVLMHGALCAEPLMPKGFVFYNPEHHQRLIALLERKSPAALITATGTNPELMGALDPFPLFVDGDFDIASVYCRAPVGEALAALQGEMVRLSIDARRVPSQASNVIASPGRGRRHKIVITAHIDAYEDTLGASDNASGVVVLLLLAEMLSDYRGAHCIEIAALNGEDHYSAGGQMDYLRRYGGEMSDILLAINIDDVGYREGGTAFSFYGSLADQQQKAQGILEQRDGLAQGAPWYNGDHMIFVQGGVPAIAMTAEYMSELMRTVTHTPADTPEIVDCTKLVQVAEALETLVRAL
jgi:aminopeptidase YwaD